MIDPSEIAHRDRILELLKDPRYVQEQMKTFTLPCGDKLIVKPSPRYAIEEVNACHHPSEG
jgi:hypothetical protein